MAHHAHHASAQAHKARVWIVAVSSTRTVETDKGGPVIARLLEESGHTVVGREVLPDAAGTVRARLLALVDDSSVDAVVLTGGTGISTRDGTYEAVSGASYRTYDDMRPARSTQLVPISTFSRHEALHE